MKAKTSSPSEESDNIPKRIEGLFLRLGAIYGHIWFSTYKNENLLELTKKEWNEGLQRFNTRVLKEALLMVRENSPYPPTLPQFIDCCKAITKRYEPFSVAPDEGEPATLEVAKKHIQEVLKNLRG